VKAVFANPSATFNERLLVAVLALVATFAFFHEYLPPFKRVHLFSDIEGYHYPLERYAFQALKEGRFPQWDPSIYCGISFVGNMQAALFYPPSWLMYAAAGINGGLPFKMLEGFAIAHVWLAFLMCYLWLRGRRLDAFASALGSGVFAYGGYMISQIVHLGVITGLTWMPLGLWGIDEAVRRRDWRPLWKTALASALCMLAGYPGSWLVHCATTFVYALTSRESWKAAAGVLIAIASSALLAIVQWLPAAEARSFMLYGHKYGGGPRSWRALMPYLVPNWLNFNRSSTAPLPDDTFYLYLGLAAMVAFAWALYRLRPRPYAQALATAAFCFLVATNPLNLVYKVVVRFPLLESAAQSYNFHEGVAAMAALITALGLHDFLHGGRKKAAPRWVMPVLVAVLAVWSIRQVLVWREGGAFPSGGLAVVQTATAVALFSIGLWAYRAESRARRTLLGAVLLITAGVDYKVFGTDRRFNTADADVDRLEVAYGILGMDDSAYGAIWANRSYRIASDEHGAPHSTDYRRWGLSTPQGFDPFLPGQYYDVITRWVPFKNNRHFYVDIENEQMLQTLGVRYVITHEGVGNEARLAASRNFHLVGRGDSYYRVYEYWHAKRPFGWEGASGQVRLTDWAPERRAFHAQSEHGGRFFLVEQFFPGWKATVDGRPAEIERWNGAFQAIRVQPGEHTVVFEYRSSYLIPGAVISLAAVAGFLAIILADRRAKKRYNSVVTPGVNGSG
jgi:hypothetical protein